MKYEIRISKYETNPKLEIRKLLLSKKRFVFGISEFDIASDFEF